MAAKFYKDLFTSDPTSGESFIKGCFPPVSEEARKILEAEYSIAETSKSLKGMGSLKTSRPDDYQPMFFMRIGS